MYVSRGQQAYEVSTPPRGSSTGLHHFSLANQFENPHHVMGVSFAPKLQHSL